jgi:type II secretory pathway predicted ATPase ExeA
VEDNTHPLLQQHGFTFKAPPLVEFVDAFSRLVINGELSMLCYGEPRAGKTTARRFLQERFFESKKMVVVSAIIVRDVSTRESRSLLWRELLRGKSQDANLLTTRPYDTLFNMLCVEADVLKTRKVLLILDEAQNLSVDNLAKLKKLVDELIEHKLSPFVLLVAQPEVLARSARLKAHNYEDLIDRFFTRVYRFRGVKIREIPGVLRLFDSEIWPKDSGISYTAHFLPEPWRKGWRLENQARSFEAEFAALHKRLNTGSDEVGMKYLVTAVRVLFNDLAGAAPDGDGFATRVKQAVSDCGLDQSYRIVGHAETAAIAFATNIKRKKISARDA